MKIYKLQWYLTIEERTITKLIANRKIALDRWNDLYQVIRNGHKDISYVSLQELVENDFGEFEEGETLHHCEC